jgi:hypothetical protein
MVKGHGEKFTRRHEQAIVALLEEPTVSAAADRVGVSESTLRRWQHDSTFEAAYRDARSQLLDRALTELRKAGTGAVHALVKNLDCGVPGAEVKAASELLRWVFQLVELEEIEDRISHLEQQQGLRSA